jgi:hypothetical protein
VVRDTSGEALSLLGNGEVDALREAAAELTREPPGSSGQASCD